MEVNKKATYRYILLSVRISINMGYVSYIINDPENLRFGLIFLLPFSPCTERGSASPSV